MKHIRQKTEGVYTIVICEGIIPEDHICLLELPDLFEIKTTEIPEVYQKLQYIS